MSSVHTILLTGTVGVGKSTVLVEIGDLLESRDDPYGLVDADWLAWIRPAAASGLAVDQILAENLGHVCATFRRAGVRRLVVARAIGSVADVDAIHAALGVPTRMVRIHLTADPDVIAGRLAARDQGERLDEHLAEVHRFSDPVAHPEIGFVAVATDALAPASVARAVLTAAGW
jgi:adenylylsulfate kinase